MEGNKKKKYKNREGKKMKEVKEISFEKINGREKKKNEEVKS